MNLNRPMKLNMRQIFYIYIGMVAVAGPSGRAI